MLPFHNVGVMLSGFENTHFDLMLMLNTPEPWNFFSSSRKRSNSTYIFLIPSKKKNVMTG